MLFFSPMRTKWQTLLDVSNLRCTRLRRLSSTNALEGQVFQFGTGTPTDSSGLALSSFMYTCHKAPATGLPWLQWQRLCPAPEVAVMENGFDLTQLDFHLPENWCTVHPQNFLGHQVVTMSMGVNCFGSTQSASGKLCAMDDAKCLQTVIHWMYDSTLYPTMTHLTLSLVQIEALRSSGYF